MIDGDTAKKIAIDVATGVSPTDSKLLYDKPELEYYQTLVKQYAAIKIRNPNASIDIRE